MNRPRHISGELVYSAIRDNPGIPSRAAIAEVTGLSLNQVSAGILWVKEIAAYEHKTPFTWNHLNGYQVTRDFDFCDAYEDSQTFGTYNKMKRTLLGTIAPHAALAPQNARVHKLQGIYEVTLDSFAALLNVAPLDWPLPKAPAGK